MSDLCNKPAMCFTLWMLSKPGEGVTVTVDQVRDTWAVSRATAYRMLASYREAKLWAKNNFYYRLTAGAPRVQ